MSKALEEAFYDCQGKEDRESLEIQIKYAEFAVDNITKSIEKNKAEKRDNSILINSLEYWRQQREIYREKLYKPNNGDEYRK